MHSLHQRQNECSLASIATLNGLTQSDYFVISDLAREAGANYLSSKTLTKAIKIGLKIAKELGFYVPANYPASSPTGAGTALSATRKESSMKKQLRFDISRLIKYNDKFYKKIQRAVRKLYPDAQPVPSAFDGKGIVRIQFKRRRCRNWTAHVIAFNNGTLYESDGVAYNSWAELADAYAKSGNRGLIITKIFK